MADNVDITPGSGATIAADEVAGAKYQRVKIAVGADGTAADATPSVPLPVGAVADTSAITNAGTSLTPKYALANVAASTTDGSVVAAVTSKKIRVLAIAVLSGSTATNITFNTKPAGAGSAKSCLFANGANGGFILPFNPVGWFETNSGEGLSATTGAGSTTGIQVTYVEV